MAMHFAGTPVSCMANVHCAAATENFLVLENHSVDVPWWDDLVDGVEKPIVNKGFITVPDKPGLGVTLNDEVVKQHLLEPGYFEPTPEWDKRTFLGPPLELRRRLWNVDRRSSEAPSPRSTFHVLRSTLWTAALSSPPYPPPCPLRPACPAI